MHCEKQSLSLFVVIFFAEQSAVSIVHLAHIDQFYLMLFLYMGRK